MMLLPIGRVNISAIIQIAVTIRNIRSYRLILWSWRISIHFFITQTFTPSNIGLRKTARTGSYFSDLRAKLIIRAQQRGVMRMDKVCIASFPRQLQFFRLCGKRFRADG